MTTTKCSYLLLPALALAYGCSSNEPERSSSSLRDADAGSESVDNPRIPFDAGGSTPSVASNVASSVPESSTTERPDAGAANDDFTSVPSTNDETTNRNTETVSTQTTSNDSTTASTNTTSMTNSTSSSAQEGLSTDPSALQWRTCGPGRCGTVEVPVAYDDPLGPTLGLRVFVGPATSERRGALYFNPGGPGESVVAYDAFQWWYAELNRLVPSMDIVLMDNRGIGDSEPVDCISPEEMDAKFADRTIGSDLEFFEVYADYWRALNDACVSTLGESKLANFHTANVARDMDRVRAALGEEQINLWMVSYGTVQASAYASLFPERVGAFVLDSPAYVGQMTNVDDLVNGAIAYERELMRFLEWCAQEEACGLGDTSHDVKSNYDALRAELEQGVVLEDYVLTAQDLDSLAENSVMYGYWDSFAATLRELADGYWTALLPEDPGSDSNEEAGWRFHQTNAIYRLMDYGCPASFGVDEALQLGNGLREDAPHFAYQTGILLSQCAGWYTRPAEQRVITKELPSVPVLIITSAHDAATPLDGAQALQADFNNGSQLYVSQRDGHGVLSNDEAASTAASDFLRTGSLNSFCEQLPCLETGALDPNLNSLRVPTKPEPGKQRLPKLPPAPDLRLRRR